MSEAATAQWIDVVPSEDQRRILDTWARERGIRLVAPTEVPAASRRVDPSLAGTVELDLEAAREAVAKLDSRDAEIALAHADRTLRAHPELPEAAWLLAEVNRGWAARWSRIEPKDEARATEAWSSARVLDGGRLAGVGEQSFAATEDPVAYALEADVPRDVAMTLDGTPIVGGAQKALPGLHQLRALRGGEVVFASWVSIAASSPIRIALAGAPPCSTVDFANVHLSGSGLSAPGVRCERWVAAIRVDNGRLRVARCVRDACSAPLPSTILWEQPAVERPRSRWPGWATWSLVGAGVLAATGVALGAAGVFTPGSTSTVFVNGGIRAEALPSR